MRTRHGSLVTGVDAVRSRTKKIRGATDQAPVRADSRGHTPQAPGPSDGRSDRSPHEESAAPPKARGSRRALKNWRVRSRLLLLVAIPTLTALVLGGLHISSSIQSAGTYQRVETLANLGQDILVLSQNLEDERDQTVYYIALGADGGRVSGLSANPTARSQAALEQAVVARAVNSTDQSATPVRNLAAQIGSTYPAQTQQAAATVLTTLSGLQYLRNASIGSQLPALVVVQKYTQVIDDVLALNDEISQSASDPTLAQTVRVLGLVSAMKEQASEQRAILAAALLQGSFGPGQLAALEAAQSAQQSNLAAFDISASVGQRQLWNNSVDQSFAYLANSEELQAISLAGSGASLLSGPTTAVDWFGAMSNTIEFQMGSVENQLAATVTSRAASLRKDAITSAVVVGAAVLLVLALALLFTIIVGRSMIRPLQRLRSGALQVAGVGLPEAVRRMSETDDPATGIEVDPIDVDSADEIGEVARAFDQVHKEALQLAANEAALRGNVNAMFVNLSRRSQSLVERQIRLIDDLEQGEQDAERLANLFQMDHLATRMRRNSENLLVLAGHDLSRRWSQPVALVDVLRAAVSEIEQYERVSLNVQPGIALRGQAVNDVVHLLAELAENATSLSSADTPVNIAGHLLNSGGVLIDITDQGVGMGAEEMAHANWRLDNPPVVDVAVSRRMGLFVVGRLAARHGVRVRLRPAASGGLTALVWVPDEVITHDTGPVSPGLSSMETTDSGADLFATELAGLDNADWLDPDRATTEQEVSSARTPKFAPLRVEGEDAPPIPRRVPGASLPSDSVWPATGALPAFQPDWSSAAESDEVSAAGQPPPAVIGQETASTGQRPPLFGEQPAPDDAGSVPAFGESAFGEPAFGEPAFGEPMAGEPAFGEPAFGEPMAGEPAFGEPMAGEPAFGEPMAGEPAFSEPTGSTDARPTAPDGGLFGVGAGSGNGTSGSGADGIGAFGNGTSEAAELAGAPLGASASYSWDVGTANGGVIVPPAESLADEHRLPIFEAVESDWFRHGRNAFSSPGDAGAPESSWLSPADEGWRAAETVPAPSSAGLTPAGLPKRVPKANLVPGAAASSAAPAPSRSAAATRERFASFQRGVREGRAAASDNANQAGEDETS
jgi:hypothetical protein